MGCNQQLISIIFNYFVYVFVWKWGMSPPRQSVCVWAEEYLNPVALFGHTILKQP